MDTVFLKCIIFFVLRHGSLCSSILTQKAKICFLGKDVPISHHYLFTFHSLLTLLTCPNYFYLFVSLNV